MVETAPTTKHHQQQHKPQSEHNERDEPPVHKKPIVPVQELKCPTETGVVKHLMDLVRSRDPDQKEFHQAVLEILQSISPLLIDDTTTTTATNTTTNTATSTKQQQQQQQQQQQPNKQQQQNTALSSSASSSSIASSDGTMNTCSSCKENYRQYTKAKYQNQYVRVLKKILEPERVITFRVSWLDDRGVEHTNRGYRVQFNSALGPYKGGLRFHPSVNLSILKFLAWEQMFKNALTDLPLGGAKGGSNFNPKGRSDGEIMRFCQAFMNELWRHIGPHTDVPAGDIGVGNREIGYLFGQYKKIRNDFTGILTGKGEVYGGSLLRPEATGFGVVIFLEQMVKHNDETLADKVCTVSGSGNVALYCALKLVESNARVVTLSDSSGFVYEPNGFTMEQLEYMIHLKTELRGRVQDYCSFSRTAQYFENEKPWSRIKCDIACPCATQNEVTVSDAAQLYQRGCRYVVEGANMPSTNEAIQFYVKNKMWYGPGKAANAGGVAVSGLEMSQNSMRMRWTREEVYEKLDRIMKTIFEECRTCALKYDEESKEDGYINYVVGANISAFLKLAEATIQQGTF